MALPKAEKNKNVTETMAKGVEQSTKVFEEEKTKGVKRTAKKPSSDYLRFDLRPLGGTDYKTYIEEQARVQSVKLGVNVSATKYLHTLIDKDMETSKGTKRTVKTDIIDMLDSLDDTQLKALNTIIKGMIK